MSEESRFRFTKPAGKRYVDMCIEFDNEFYGPDRDDDKLFCYVFLLFKMFAYKSNYFRDREDYDQYAMFAASTVYMRYIRKWARGERIKSILNYVKKVKGPLKVTYQNENFAQIFDPERDNKTDGDGMKRWHHEYVQRQFDAEMTAEVGESLDALPSLLAKAVGESRFAKDPIVAKNLLISALLTFIDRITPTEAAKEAASARGNPDSMLLKSLEAESKRPPTLWKLPKGMGAEVEVVINKARAWASDGINEIRGRYTLPDDVLDDILSSAYADAKQVEFGEDD